MTLHIDQFDAFFTEVHEGFSPFPWQSDLARKVWETKTWPDAIQIDTGLGKTSYLDIAVFMLALQAYEDPSKRVFPVRIIHVVNRRVVVDDVADHGRVIRNRLEEALENPQKYPVCCEVAKRLIHYTPIPATVTAEKSRYYAKPLVVAKLRGGGIRKDDLWFRRPDQPLILSTTVDQFGSRYLFRGYLTSPKLAAIHTALVANDALVVMDEAHLSQPLVDTIRQMDQRERRKEFKGLPHRRHLLQMSATLGVSSSSTIFRIDPNNLGGMEKRFRVSKPSSLIDGKTKLVEHVLKCVRNYLNNGHNVIGVVVNQVASARDIAEVCKATGVDTHLITGRMRPFDRDEFISTVIPRLRPGRVRSNDRPLVVVSTQCIEVGADFDFDAMISECASIDALRQRVGRVDRLGDYGKSEIAIIQTSNEIVYGPAKEQTWLWLNARKDPKNGSFDFGHASFRAFESDLADSPNLFHTPNRAPILSTVDIDLLVQTGPRPYPDISVEPFIHGLECNTPEVHLLWRADLDVSEIPTEDEIERVSRRIQLRTPSPREMLAIPIYALAGLFRNHTKDLPVPDIIGSTLKTYVRDSFLSRVLRFNRDPSPKKEHSVESIKLSEVRPGDTLILPSSVGGIRNGSWNPLSQDNISDIGDVAIFQHTRLPLISLHPSILGFDISGFSKAKDVLARLEARVSDLPPGYDEILRALQDMPLKDLDILYDGDDCEGHASRAILHSNNKRAPYLDEDEDGFSFLGRKIALDVHLGHVETWARIFAASVGMPESIVEDIAVAGKWHDLGKAEPRFQLALYGGHPSSVGGTLLAKSSTGKTSREVQKHLRDVYKFPKGWRHEILSVAMLEDHPSIFNGVTDPELVRHLVGSHHGRCRPYAPPVEDNFPFDVVGDINGLPFSRTSQHALARLDSEIPERFGDLNASYGIYILAWFEAILRMADVTASILEAEGNMV